MTQRVPFPVHVLALDPWKDRAALEAYVAAGHHTQDGERIVGVYVDALLMPHHEVHVTQTMGLCVETPNGMNTRRMASVAPESLDATAKLCLALIDDDVLEGSLEVLPFGNSTPCIPSATNKRFYRIHHFGPFDVLAAEYLANQNDDHYTSFPPDAPVGITLHVAAVAVPPAHSSHEAFERAALCARIDAIMPHILDKVWDGDSPFCPLPVDPAKVGESPHGLKSGASAFP